MTEAPFDYPLFRPKVRVTRTADEHTLLDLLAIAVVEEKRCERLQAMGIELDHQPHLRVWDVALAILGMAELQDRYDALAEWSEEALGILDDACDGALVMLMAAAKRDVVNEALILSLLEGLRALMAESLAKARAWPASSTLKTL